MVKIICLYICCLLAEKLVSFRRLTFRQVLYSPYGKPASVVLEKVSPFELSCATSSLDSRLGYLLQNYLFLNYLQLRLFEEPRVYSALVTLVILHYPMH